MFDFCWDVYIYIFIYIDETPSSPSAMNWAQRSDKFSRSTALCN